MHTFSVQLAAGRRGEQILDAVFTPHYQVVLATRELQRRGVDRILESRLTGHRTTVEYKTDWRAGRTGNAFVETISVSTTGRQGWAYTAEAEWLVYYVPGRRLAYCIRFDDLRSRLPAWATTYRVCAAANHGYATHGLIVPLEELAASADHMLQELPAVSAPATNLPPFPSGNGSDARPALGHAF